MVEGQTGLTWERLKALTARVEDLGFAGLYRSDHFTGSAPPNEDSLEMIVSLTYVADHTRRIHFGPMVAPVSFRDPVMLARQAAHIDALSDGRMILGVGAGWSQREHEMFGYPLLDKRARMERFIEGVRVIHGLLKSDTPVTFQGRWYTLREAEILPRPNKTRILVGGNGMNVTLPLAARFGDVWNGVGISPQRFTELAALLDKNLYDAGRETNAVKKTVAVFSFFGRTKDEVAERMQPFRNFRDEWQTMPQAELAAHLREHHNVILGLPEDVIPQIQAYADAGVEELLLQFFAGHEIDVWDTFAKEVLPLFSGSAEKI